MIAALRTLVVTGEKLLQSFFAADHENFLFSGWPKYALDYVKTNGLNDDDNYPYFAEKDTKCWYLPTDKIGSVTNTFTVQTKGEMKFPKLFDNNSTGSPIRK